jgi:Rrf2 family protein
MISQKAKYALRALVSLAQAPKGEPVFISDIAEKQSIPKKFLEQILLDLKRHGILVSRRGKFGGYQLLKDPSEITFGSVLRIVDGPIAPLPCLSKMAYRRCDDCKSEGNCEIRRVFAEVAEATRGVLDRRTIADAIGAGAAIQDIAEPRKSPADSGKPRKVKDFA